MVAALIVPGSEIELPAILLNPRRTGLIETCWRWAREIEITQPAHQRRRGDRRSGRCAIPH